jgi:hypothetical protein
MEEKIKIELTNEEAEVFKWCWKNYDIFSTAIKILKPGNLVLHLDKSAWVSRHEYHIFNDQRVCKTLLLTEKQK